MSSNWSIDEEIFDKPSGDVRGIVLGLVGSGKSEKRVILARIHTNAPPSISTWTLNKPSIDDLRAHAELLAAFAKRLEELES